MKATVNILTRNASLARRLFCVSLVAVAWSGCRHASPDVGELSIVSEEYGFRMPDSIPAGLVHITLHNAGKDLHEAMFARFTDTIGTAAAYADSVRAHVEWPSNAE